MKIAAGDRHRQGRPHLPCRHRGARTGHSRRGGRDARDREAQDRGTVSRSPAPKATSATSIRATVAFDVTRNAGERASSSRTPRSWSMSAPRKWHSAPRMQPQAGVGLARMEFIISEHIGVHPMALLKPREDHLGQARGPRSPVWSQGYNSPADFFIQTLAEGVGTIAAAFYPKPVIVRLSDFKTNEYASLLGGEAFEPKEENPMLGFRGASRYSHPAYAEGFALECAALRRVREEMGLSNLRIMVPFCRTVEEGAARDRDDGGQRPQARRGRARDLRDVRDSRTTSSRSTRSRSCSTAFRSARTISPS